MKIQAANLTLIFLNHDTGLRIGTKRPDGILSVRVDHVERRILVSIVPGIKLSCVK